MTSTFSISGQYVLDQWGQNTQVFTPHVGVFINLDQIVLTDPDLGKEFLDEHCPLEVISVDEKLVLKETATGKEFNIEHNQSISYSFKGNDFHITFTQAD